VIEHAAGTAGAAIRDRVGLAWRPELAAGIHLHLDRIDAIEVIAEHWLDARPRELAMLRALARSRPLDVHGVSLGMASASPTAPRLLDRLARLVHMVEPEGWSEHLAFVRAGGVEIGHLAAAPRTPATMEGTLRNLEAATARVGRRPLVENIATLVEPPCSSMDEAAWIDAIVKASDSDLLLDLHNLYANACNRNEDARDLLGRLPLGRVRRVHLAGGRWETARSGARRRLDDHLHATPGPVFELLEDLASRVPQSLTVIVERDGQYPPISELLEEMASARTALARGRSRSTNERAGRLAA